MGGIGPWQILIIVLIVLLLFGASKLPTLARSAGRSMRIFKSEMTEMQNDGRPAVEGSTKASGADDFSDGISDDIRDAGDLPADPEKRTNGNQAQGR